jgi:hypothetical protein
MRSYELVIEPRPPAAPLGSAPRAPTKTRAFRATYLAHICANPWRPGGEASADATRPAWLLFAAPERAARPFVANLQTGHRALLQPYDAGGGWRGGSPVALELLKSAGYRFLWQRVPGGAAGAVALVTAYLPELFALDPGLIDPAGVAFLALTPTWWIAREQARLATDSGATAAVGAHLAALGLLGAPWPGGGPPWTAEELLALLPQAVHVVTYLERRTTRPLVSAPAFALQLFLAALERGILTMAHPTDPGGRLPAGRPGAPAGADDRWAWGRAAAPPGFVECQTAAVGLAPPVACRVDHPTLDAFLGAEVTRYFAAQPREEPNEGRAPST